MNHSILRAMAGEQLKKLSWKYPTETPNLPSINTPGEICSALTMYIRDRSQGFVKNNYWNLAQRFPCFSDFVEVYFSTGDSSKYKLHTRKFGHFSLICIMVQFSAVFILALGRDQKRINRQRNRKQAAKKKTKRPVKYPRINRKRRNPRRHSQTGDAWLLWATFIRERL